MSTVQSQIEKKFDIHVKEHPGELLQHINSAWKERRLCDFLIKVGSKEIPVHKIILSEGSDYFKAMFSHKMKEVESGVAVMEGVDPECMLKCIEYVYTGKVSVPESKVQPLLQVASMLQLTRLCEVIGAFLEANLDPDSFFLTLKIANTFNLQGLKNHCEKYALENFSSIAVKEEFRDLEKEYVQFLIKSKEARASEALKCKAIITWASKDVESRSASFEQMFQLLDLKNMPAEYLKHLEEKEALVYESNTCLRRLFRTLMEAKNASAKDVSFQEYGIVQHPTNVIAVFETKSESIQAFNPANKSWTRVHGLTDQIFERTNERFFTSVALRDEIYILAINKKNYKIRYTDPDASWIRLPDRRVTCRVMAVLFNGVIYAFDDTGSESNAVEIFDPVTTTVSEITQKPNSGYDTSVVVAGDFIYCIGGYQDRRIADADKFNPSSKTWVRLPSMPTPRDGAAASEFNGNIYVMGGYLKGYLETVECFNISTENWITLNPMNTPRAVFKSWVIAGKIYVIGGNSVGSTIAEFDPSKGQWTEIYDIQRMEIEPRASLAIKWD